ncbi:YojF family protein [Alteribacter aurantiacus]|uniref:YojF family protein n=1 Tax=Alteribacter aurantiacus TaxID=254410 RepID=UPI0003F80402|nr:YojF family protein [Alteribacter aurantiacus]
MKPIDQKLVQQTIDELAGKELYVHLETTNGAYATHKNQGFFSVGTFLRNARIKYVQGKITGPGPYRIGLELEGGWAYAEGLTDWEVDDQNQVLFAGHDPDGKLAIAFQLSEKPFRK